MRITSALLAIALTITLLFAHPHAHAVKVVRNTDSPTSDPQPNHVPGVPCLPCQKPTAPPSGN